MIIDNWTLVGKLAKVECHPETTTKCSFVCTSPHTLKQSFPCPRSHKAPSNRDPKTDHVAAVHVRWRNAKLNQHESSIIHFTATTVRREGPNFGTSRSTVWGWKGPINTVNRRRNGTENGSHQTRKRVIRFYYRCGSQGCDAGGCCGVAKRGVERDGDPTTPPERNCPRYKYIAVINSTERFNIKTTFILYIRFDIRPPGGHIAVLSLVWYKLRADGGSWCCWVEDCRIIFHCDGGGVAVILIPSSIGTNDCCQQI